jgi:hypothetical protein
MSEALPGRAAADAEELLVFEARAPEERSVP